MGFLRGRLGVLPSPGSLRAGDSIAAEFPIEHPARAAPRPGGQSWIGSKRKTTWRSPQLERRTGCPKNFAEMAIVTRCAPGNFLLAFKPARFQAAAKPTLSEQTLAIQAASRSGKFHMAL